MAVALALCCLGCSAVNDLVFRLYARKVRSRGVYMAMIGVVWAIAVLACSGHDFGRWRGDIWWGTAAGAFSVLANIFYLEAIARMEVNSAAPSGPPRTKRVNAKHRVAKTREPFCPSANGTLTSTPS